MLYYYSSASSLKQQSASRHVVLLLWHIILIPDQRFFNLSPYICICVLSGNAAIPMVSLPKPLPDLTLYISNTVVSFKKQEMLIVLERMSSYLVFGGVSVALLFSFLSCVLFLSPSCVLCTQYCQFVWIVHYWLPTRFIYCLWCDSTFIIFNKKNFLRKYIRPKYHFWGKAR